MATDTEAHAWKRQSAVVTSGESVKLWILKTCLKEAEGKQRVVLERTAHQSGLRQPQIELSDCPSTSRLFLRWRDAAVLQPGLELMENPSLNTNPNNPTHSQLFVCDYHLRKITGPPWRDLWDKRFLYQPSSAMVHQKRLFCCLEHVCVWEPLWRWIIRHVRSICLWLWCGEDDLSVPRPTEQWWIIQTHVGHLDVP